MTEAIPPRQPGEIIYHFDVKPSSIPLAQFVDTARATQEIVDDFNRSLFDGKVKYELRVKTPEEGSLLEVLAIIVTTGGSVLAFLGTDIGKAFFKGLTLEEPAAWAEKIGASIRHRLNKATPPPVTASEHIDVVQPSADVTTGSEAEIELLTEAEAIALILLRFLEFDADKLRMIGITPEKFRAAFQGRNRIFKACIDNAEVEGLAFDRTPDFRLRRTDFPRQITQLPDPPAEEAEKVTDWSIETVDIVVNSPNWKRDGRKWQAATNKHQDIAFSVEDDGFWLAVDSKDIQPDIKDNMRVQWAYPAGLSKPSGVRVLRVLGYNGKPISTAMTEKELKSILTNIHEVEPDTPDLFDERRGWQNNNSEGNT